jgi:hypothetical protein
VSEAPLVAFALPDRFEIDGPEDPTDGSIRGGNEASERALERTGFTREGVKRRLLRHGTGRADATLFSLLPDE